MHSNMPHESLPVNLPERLLIRLQGLLANGERLLWCAQPAAGRLARYDAFRAAVKGLAPLLVGASLFAIGGLWNFVNPGIPVTPWLWWAAWGIVGLTAISVSWKALCGYRWARHTLYAITDRRVIVCQDLLLSRGWSLTRDEIELVKLRVWPRGIGEVLFEPRAAQRSAISIFRESTILTHLDDIDGARRALEQLLGRDVPAEIMGRASGDFPLRSDPTDLRPSPDHLPDGLRERLLGVLEESERILWLGQPSPRTMMLRAGVKSGCSLVLIAAAAGAFAACAGLMGQLLPGAAWPNIVWWLLAPLVGLAGLAVVVGVLSARYRSRRTAYVITDRRALIVQVGIGAKVYSYGRTALDGVQVRELDNGSGEVIFEEKTRIEQSESGPNQVRKQVVGFIEVKPIEPARKALEEMLGRPVAVERVETVSLDQEHTI